MNVCYLVHNLHPKSIHPTWVSDRHHNPKHPKLSSWFPSIPQPAVAQPSPSQDMVPSSFWLCKPWDGPGPLTLLFISHIQSLRKFHSLCNQNIESPATSHHVLCYCPDLSHHHSFLPGSPQQRPNWAPCLYPPRLRPQHRSQNAPPLLEACMAVPPLRIKATVNNRPAPHNFLGWWECCSISLRSNMVATGPMWLSNTWNMASETEKLHFKVYFV